MKITSRGEIYDQLSKQQQIENHPVYINLKRKGIRNWTYLVKDSFRKEI